MSQEIKRMNIKEFREKGYLQELNRRFLHPLGLALEVEINDETGEEKLGGVWDSREDPEGFLFDFSVEHGRVIEKNKQKAEFIDNEFAKREAKRKKLFGNIIEPIK